MSFPSCNKLKIECVNAFITDKGGTITNDNHHIEGIKVSKGNASLFYGYGPNIIKVKGSTVTIVDRFEREYSFKLSDTTFSTMFALKNFLVSCNCLCDSNAVTGGDLKIIENTPHSFVMPAHGFIPVTFKAGSWNVANTTTADFLHEMFIVEILNADSFVVQQNGFLTVSGGHGLTVSEYYYLTDTNYTVALVPDTEHDDVLAFTIDSECLMLIDNRPIDLTVNDEGLQLPVMDTATRDAIVTPLTGKMIYNSTTDQIEVVNNAGAWKVAP